MATPSISPLTDAQMRRSVYLATLLATLLPPFVGGSLMGVIGFYPMPELYLIFLSYTGPYVLVVAAACLFMVPRIMQYLIDLTQMEKDAAKDSAQHVFTRLPWLLFCGETLYTICGVMTADISLDDMGLHTYTLRDDVYNELGTLPVVLISVFPIFFFFIDQLGRYLGPRGISITAIPLFVKPMMLGIVTPLLIDSVLLGYYVNRTGYFKWGTPATWLSLMLLAVGGTWIAWRSLRQSMAPLEAFITSRSGSPPPPLSRNKAYWSLMPRV
jgi:hypothetical protein